MAGGADVADGPDMASRTFELVKSESGYGRRGRCGRWAGYSRREIVPKQSQRTRELTLELKLISDLPAGTFRGSLNKDIFRTTVCVCLKMDEAITLTIRAAKSWPGCEKPGHCCKQSRPVTIYLQLVIASECWAPNDKGAPNDKWATNDKWAPNDKGAPNDKRAPNDKGATIPTNDKWAPNDKGAPND
ncbi:hypothetical protein Btru_047353 [Bulinus truncatus]|nr:hypothetical protein Btru_047353 [Bulinus truncatus]